MKRLTSSVLALGAALAAIAVTAATAQHARLLLPLTIAPGADPAASIEGLASLAAALLGGWLSLALTATLAAQCPGGLGALGARLRDRVTPALVRRAVAVALGACVSASVGAPAAHAEPGTKPVTVTDTHPSHPKPQGPGWSAVSRASDPGVQSTSPGPGWLPLRPPTRHRTEPNLLARTRPAGPPHEVVVHRGDTLWSIAARHLGPGASPDEIAASWPHWHARNRERIGPDPHTILPGTRLVPPDRHHDPGTRSPGDLAKIFFLHGATAALGR